MVDFQVTNPGGSYNWDFQSDGTFDATGPNVSFIFPASASDQTYTVTLYRNNIPCETADINVLATPDATLGVIPGSGILTGNQIRVCSATPDVTLSVFNASSTYANNTSYTIDWGDGSSDNYTNATFPNTGSVDHDYFQYGYYTIQLTVTGNNGCINSENYTFYNGSNPSVGLANPGNTVGLCVPATLTFPITNTANNPEGTEYYVFVNGQAVDSFTQNNVPPSYTHLFLESSCGETTSTGNYQNAFDVQVVATNPCGSSQATIEPIELSEPPEPLFEVNRPTIGCQEEVFTITNASTAQEVVSGNPSNCSTNLAPTWSITPGVNGVDWVLLSGNLFNAQELQIQFLIPGTYSIEMIIHSDACGDFVFAEDFLILELAEAEAVASLVTASFPAVANECAPTLGSFINTSTGDSVNYSWVINPPTGWSFVDTTNLNTEHLNVSFDQAGSYTVFLTTSNFCSSDTWDTTLLIAGDPIVNLLPPADSCQTATLNFDASNVFYNANGGTLNDFSWSFPGATPSTSSDQYPGNIHYSSPGTYTITLTTSNQCGSSTTSTTLVVQQPGDLTISNDTTVCAFSPPFQLASNFSGGNWSGNGVSSGGLFTPDASNIGVNSIYYRITDGGCPLLDSLLITVVAAPLVDAGTDEEVCENEAAYTLSGFSPAGGTWSIDNGGVISGNQFDPVASGAGTYTLTYTFADVNGCNNFDEKEIIVHPLPVVDAGPNQSICENPNDIPLTGFSPTGGIWSGTGVTPDGVFNAANASGVGTYTLYYNYTDPGTSCTNQDSLLITVISNAVADAGPDQSVCLNDPSFVLNSGTPLGGTWTGNGVDSFSGLFDPAAAGAGVHVLTYTTGVGYCQTNDTKVITVQALPQITVPADRAICLNEMPLTLNAIPLGGTWSGIGISGNTFDPATAGEGQFTLTYEYTHPVTGCSNTADMNIEVYPLPVLQLKDTLYCNTPGLVDLPTANPTGGAWSGPGVVGNQFEPQIAGGAGNYRLAYRYVNTNGCSNTDSMTVQVIDPAAVQAGDDLVICIDAALIDLSQQSSPAGGVWNSNGSNGLNNGIFNPATAGVGVHILTYQIGNGNCQVSDNVVIDIRPLPVVEAGPPLALCQDAPAQNLSGFTPTGGEWSGPGVTDPIAGTIDPKLLNPGDYQLTYSFTNALGCSNQDELTFTVYPLPIVDAGPDTIFCDAAIDVVLNSPTPTGGIWSGPGIVSPYAGTFNPQQAGGEGQYTLVYTYTHPITGCINSDSLVATVLVPTTIEAGPNDTICIDQGLHQLTGQSAIAGTWTGRGIVDPVLGTFNPILAGGGTHTLFFTYGVGSCLVRDYKTVRVVDLRYVDAGPNESFCINEEAISLSGYIPAGGVWSGAGITDPYAGTFDPAVAQTGQHTLTYTYTDEESGCISSSEKIITIFPMEPLDFLLPELACRNELVDFTNLSPIQYTMDWDFGDGRTSTAYSPQHAYFNAGTYIIKLTATNEFGCVDTVSHTIVITDKPTAYFVPDTTEACSGINLELINQSTGYGLSHDWQLGNGLQSSEVDPGVVFYGQGIRDTSYIITLTVSNLCGSSTYQDLITVHPLPIAGFGFSPESDCSPIVINFANNTTGSATDFFWDFGNGNTSTEIVPEPQTYTTDSLTTYYDVTLIASNICGADTLTEQITIAPSDVQAFFEVSDDKGCMPFTVDFYNVATPGANIDWDFGDGNTSSSLNPVHTFDTAGTYTVIQYASSDCGFDSISLVITVLPQPNVAFTHEREVCFGRAVQFINQSAEISGNHWDFGDGDSSLLSNPTHLYDRPGTYAITLTSSSIFNQCPASFTSEVTILEPPRADFEPSTFSGCVPLAVDFENRSTGATFYTWDFGNGNSGTGINPTHVYDQVGNFDVSVVARDVYGCTDDTTRFNIQVYPKPTAGFEFEEDALCQLPSIVVFENTTEGAQSYDWSFGDGETSTYNNPNHTYTQGGDFRIRLVATNQFSCADTSISDITIYPSPIADFEVDSQEGCSPVEVLFNNISADANLFHWDFGDGNTSNAENPLHIYDEAGTYAVKLVASVDGVCYDSLELSRLVRVFPTPHASFIADELIVNELATGTYDLLNQSTHADTYFWDFGDGGTSEVENPRHRYDHSGNYQIYLEVSNVHGCVDDTLVNIQPELIKGLFLPNALSPETGIGDVRVFRPSGIGLKEYKCQIFSPYGQLLWESQDLDEDGRPTEAWDGTYQGQLLPQDVYVWKAFGIFQDGTNWRGERTETGTYKTMGSVLLLR